MKEHYSELGLILKGGHCKKILGDWNFMGNWPHVFS